MAYSTITGMRSTRYPLQGLGQLHINTIRTRTPRMPGLSRRFRSGVVAPTDWGSLKGGCGCGDTGCAGCGCAGCGSLGTEGQPPKLLSFAVLGLMGVGMLWFMVR